MNTTRFTAIALVVLLLAGLGVTIFGGDPGTPEERQNLPRSIAAIGDSITRAAALDPSLPGGSPERSWATGDRPYSHLGRLLAVGASLDPEDVHNLSVSGARMQDAPAQARLAVEAEAEYVTFLMGANDVCAPQMPSVEDFRGQYLATLNILITRVPDSHLFVATIPDVGRLWTLFADDERVVQVWDAAGICPTILSSRTSDAQRAAALERLRAYNLVLEEGCAATTRCTFDGGAVYEHPFEREDVSTLDHFHPSARGQETLADVTWRAGPWGEGSS